MTREEFFDLAERYRTGKAKDKEIRLFEGFVDQMQSSLDTEPLEPDQEERLRIRLSGRLHQHLNTATPKKTNHFKKWIGIAASVLLLLSASLFIIEHIGYSKEEQIVLQTKTTARGQKSTIYLCDGTVVKLNSESKLTFSDFPGKGPREVSLEGEAFFDVAKDPERPFIVKSGKLSTTVLGTSFNISSYPDLQEQQVTVATGKVKVQQENGDDYVMLDPNEQASFDPVKGLLSKRKTDISRFISWKDGIIYLDQVRMADAAKMLEKWYGVQIKFQDKGIEDCILSGTYQNDDLKNILDGIKYIKNINYKIKTDRTIILSGKGCKNE